MESIRHQRVKLLIAGVVASAFVVIGAVAAVAVGAQQTGTDTASPMNMGVSTSVESGPLFVG
jgi:hypothetical protein